MLFNLFDRFTKKKTYTILGRARTGHFFVRHEVKARSSYEACRIFDNSECFQDLTRVSGATLVID